jgi:hypothetical protein
MANGSSVLVSSSKGKKKEKADKITKLKSDSVDKENQAIPVRFVSSTLLEGLFTLVFSSLLLL